MRLSTFFLVVLGILWTVRISGQEQKPHILNLTADSLQQLLRKADTTHYILLDVRPPDKYAAGHIPGAISIPLEELPQKISLLQQLAKDTIIVYCGDGRRSAKAIEILQKAGISAHTICNLQHGFQTWKFERMRKEHQEQRERKEQ